MDLLKKVFAITSIVLMIGASVIGAVLSLMTY